MSDEKTPRENNLETAHKALVTAKYALWALHGDGSQEGYFRQTAETAALRTEGLIDWVYGERNGVDLSEAAEGSGGPVELGIGAVLTDEHKARADELKESGWPVEQMSPTQILIAHEAEGDHNHERVSGERKVWEHEIPEAGETPGAEAAEMSTSDGLGREGVGAGTIGALRETAGLHAMSPITALGRFGQGAEFNLAEALQEAKHLHLTCADEDEPRLAELIDYLTESTSDGLGGEVVERCPECGSANICQQTRDDEIRRELVGEVKGLLEDYKTWSEAEGGDEGMDTADRIAELVERF